MEGGTLVAGRRGYSGLRSRPLLSDGLRENCQVMRFTLYAKCIQSPETKQDWAQRLQHILFEFLLNLSYASEVGTGCSRVRL